MVKTAALYLVSIKSYSKNPHPPFFFEMGNSRVDPLNSPNLSSKHT
jgi:hypothetical protein